MERMINIALVDDQNLFREGLVKLLSDYPDFNLKVEASSGQQLIDELAIQDVDVVITDIEMPEMDGFEVTKYIKSKYPKIKVLALTMHDDDNFILRLLEYGVNGYLLKDNGSSYIAKAIREVTDPESTGNFFTERISQAMYKGLKNKQKASFHPNEISFSPKELSVIQLICEEYTTPEIAKELNISPHTVNGYRERIMAKIKVNTTIGIVNYAHKHNLIIL